MKKVFSLAFKFSVYAFAVVGFMLVAGFLAVRLGYTNITGRVDPNSNRYQKINRVEPASSSSTSMFSSSSLVNLKDLALSDIDLKISELKNISDQLALLRAKKIQDICQLDVVTQISPVNARSIWEVRRSNASDWLFEQMILAVSLRLEDNFDFQKNLDDCKKIESFPKSEEDLKLSLENAKGDNLFPWANDDKWNIISKAILKDEAAINLVSRQLDVEPRLIVSVLIVEQLRLYHTQRELFEKFFKPLEILASANKMAWGVMAIKENTAIDIERNLKNSSSDFYLGPEYEHLLDFKSSDQSAERYERLTGNDHYYSYLYGGLLIKQVIHQWAVKGYDINHRPEILSTIFNLGLSKSKPKEDPLVGGSELTIGSANYTFGSLAHEFYYSGLLPEFPYEQ